MATTDERRNIAGLDDVIDVLQTSPQVKKFPARKNELLHAFSRDDSLARTKGEPIAMWLMRSRLPDDTFPLETISSELNRVFVSVSEEPKEPGHSLHNAEARICKQTWTNERHAALVMCVVRPDNVIELKDEVQEFKPNQDAGTRQVLSVQVDVSDVRLLRPNMRLVLAVNSMDVGRREGARGVIDTAAHCTVAGRAWDRAHRQICAERGIGHLITVEPD